METVWTQDLIDNLGRLWAEGHSTAEIGRRLGLTKNAVVGKLKANSWFGRNDGSPTPSGPMTSYR